MKVIPQVMPYVGEEELENLKQVIKNKWLTEGKFSEEFLELVKQQTGAEYAILVPNGTLGIYISILALGLKFGEAITTDFTFNATASPLNFAYNTPVFVDIDPGNLNIDPRKIEKKITTQTKAIIPVHIYGQSCDMDKIMSIAEEYRLKVIEDAAQAYGTKYKGKHVGTIGDVGIISFYSDKTVTCLPSETRINIKRPKNGRGISSTKKIKDILIGDSVLSYNEDIGEKEYDVVIKTYKRETKELYIISFSNGNELQITGNHPLFVVSKGWIPAMNLQTGDKIIQYIYHGLSSRKFYLSQRGTTFLERMGEKRASDWGQTFIFNPNVELPEVTAIQKISVNCEVYNIETEKNHNYFAHGILVHNCGEGGVVLTNDRRIYINLKRLRNQGRMGSGVFYHETLGMNFRMTDLQAAVAVAQLKKLDEIIQMKQMNYRLYMEHLKGCKGIKFLKEEPYSNLVPFRVPIRVKNKKEVLEHLEKNGIQTREFFVPLHRQPCFADLEAESDNEKDFPESNKAYEEGICLPVYPGLQPDQIEYICDKIKEVI